eukprot:SAG31_NODE_1807_length_7230_cov_4.804885_6_plen_56_part_00
MLFFYLVFPFVIPYMQVIVGPSLDGHINFLTNYIAVVRVSFYVCVNPNSKTALEC